ncbi:hypothetical protein AB0I28_14670 [Phytomonospora sp. NPDC050363]|uniref:hypothetical protein n=1 Tax=Phytomonospora sp. NPDC050363 TaxID=3155642 RepID=UPI0033C4289C
MKRETMLEYRYRRLLRLYPRAWRARREDEMVATYLDTGPDTRGRPSMMDTVDVARGATRHRITAADAGLRTGSAFAAEVSLLAASVLSALWFCLFELAGLPEDHLLTTFGSAQSLGAVAWIAWAFVPLAGLFLSGRWMRAAVAAALVLTVLLIPAAPLTGFFRPPLTLLAAQIALGLVALFLPDRRRPFVRALPAAATLAAAGIALAARPWETVMTYRLTGLDRRILAIAAIALFTAATVYIAVTIARKRQGGLWAFLVLLAPVMVLVQEWIPGPLNPIGRDYTPTDVVVTGGLLAIGAVAVTISAAAAWIRRGDSVGIPPSAGGGT